MVNTVGDTAGEGSFNGAFGAFALKATRPDSVTMPWAIPRSLEIKMALRIQLLVILRSRIMTQVETAMRTSTVLLALRRSRPMLTATQTTLLALRPSRATSAVCSTRPWALSLSQVIRWRFKHRHW